MLLAALMLLLGGLIIGILASPSGASGTQTPCPTEDAQVLEVEGRLDPVLVEFVTAELEDAPASCAAVVVLQLNSGGVAGDSGDLDGLFRAIESSPVPVGVWVGPSGSRAAGEAVQLLAVADHSGIATGSHIEVTSELLDARSVAPEQLPGTRVSDRVSADQAVELDLVDTEAPVVRDFIAGLPGVETRTAEQDGEAGRELVTPVVFNKLPLLGQLMHTVASPAVAYLLFISGLALLLFEMYTAGVGIAGMTGAVCVILGCYGLASLPTNPLGVALLLIAMFGYGVDVQTGVARVWTGIATVAFILGSLLLFDGMTVSWITLLAAIVGMTLFMRIGMPTMVRTRFATSALDAQGLVGERGLVRSRVSPEGVVVVNGAPWSAHTGGGTAIEPDEAVRVVASDGLALEVEPDQGQ
jgi:membrane-bound serine protease (ClpP class)